MEHWSILSNVANHMQYGRNLKNFYELDIKTIYQKNHRKIYERLKDRQDRQILELDFGNTPGKLRRGYLDMHDGIQSEVIHTTRFDENSDLSITYLGRMDITRANKIRVEEKFSISE